MPNYLSFLHFKTRLWILAIPPLLFILYLSTLKIWDSYQEYRVAKALENSMTLFASVADLGYEIQKERGMSAGYLGKYGVEAFGKVLDKQRKSTDIRYAQMESYLAKSTHVSYEAPILAQISSAKRAYEGIRDLRKRVDRRDISVEEEIALYSAINQTFFDTLPLIVKIAKEGDLKCELSALSALVYAKERLGIERATGSNMIAEEVYQPFIHTKFITQIGEYDGYIHLFFNYANPRIIEVFHQKMDDAKMSEAARIEEVLADGNPQKIKQENPLYWFNAITVRIDTLAEIRRLYMNDLQEEVEDIFTDAYTQILFNMTVFPLMILAVLFISYIVSKSLYEEIKEQQQLMLQQSKMATMGEMIGSIAHQWRQPLNSVGVLVQEMVLKWKYGKLDEGEIERITDEVLATLEYMSKTIDDFRNFFKPTKERKAFSVPQVIEGALKIIGQQIENNGIEIQYSTACGKEICDPSEFVVDGHESEFKQVLINLLNNAREAIVEREAKEPDILKMIWIDIERDEESLYVRIRDTGGGVPEKIIKTLFEPYVSTKEAQNGTGLGLYMSKMIVENSMHGELSVRNVNDGAEFTIALIVHEP